jgi:hypothetical protein
MFRFSINIMPNRLVETISKSLATGLDYLIRQTPSYQNAVRRNEIALDRRNEELSKFVQSSLDDALDRIENIKEELKESEIRADELSNNARYHQDRAESVSLKKLLPLFDKIRRRLERKKETFLILNPTDKTILHISSQITKKNIYAFKLKDKRYAKVLADSSGLSEDRYAESMLKIGRKIYREAYSKDIDGFPIVFLDDLGTLEKYTMDKHEKALGILTRFKKARPRTE